MCGCISVAGLAQEVFCERYRMNAGFTQSTDIFQPNYIWAELCLLSVCELNAQPGWSSQLQERKPKWWFTAAASKQSYPVSDLPFVSFFPLLATSCTATIKFYFTDPFLFFLPPPSWYLLSEYIDADVVFAETRRVGRVIRRKHRFLNKYYCFLWLTEQDGCEEWLKPMTWQLQVLFQKKKKKKKKTRQQGKRCWGHRVSRK